MQSKLDLEKTAFEAIKYAKSIIIKSSTPSKASLEFLKRELEAIYKHIQEKKVVTKNDLEKILKTLNRVTNSNKTSSKISYELIKQGLELLERKNVNIFSKRLYEKLYDSETPEDIKNIIENIIKTEKLSNNLSSIIATSYFSLPFENIIDENELKRKFLNDIYVKIDRIDNFKEKKQIEEMWEKSKKQIEEIFFGDVNNYDKFVDKYINLKKIHNEQNIVTNLIQSVVFKEFESENFYKNKARTLKEFMEKYIFEEYLNEEKIYEKFFNLELKNDDETIEIAKKIEQTIEAINKINNSQFYLSIDGKKVSAFDAINKNLGLNEDLVKIKDAVMSIEKYNIKQDDLEKLTPHEIEALKQSALDKYYQRTLLGIYKLDKPGIISKALNKTFFKKINTDFFNPDGTINPDKYILNPIVDIPKAKLLKCLANAMNPKHTYETGAGSSSQCIEKFISEIEKLIQEYDKFLSQHGVKELAGFLGLAPFLHYLRQRFIEEKYESEAKSVVLEKNYYEIKEMIMKLKNPLEIKQAEKYLELISKSENNEIVIGDTLEDLNAIISLGIKDLSNYYVNYDSAQEFLRKKISMMEKKILNSNKKFNKYQKIIASGKKVEGFSDFEVKVFQKLLESGIDKIDEENKKEIKKIIRNVIEEQNKKIFEEKFYDFYELSEDSMFITQLISDKKELEKVITDLKQLHKQAVKNYKEFLSNPEPEKDEKKLEILKKEIISIEEKLGSTLEKMKHIQNSLFYHLYKDDAKKYEEVENIITEIEEKHKRATEIRQLIKNTKNENILELVNELESIEYKIKELNEKLEEIAKRKSPDLEKIEKIENFLQQGKVILTQEDLKLFANKLKEISKEGLEDVLYKKFKAINIDTPNKIEKDYVEKILDVKMKLELLFAQEAKTKEILLDSLSKKDIDNAQYYATIYNQTIDMIEENKKQILELKKEILEKTDEVMFDRYVLNVNDKEVRIPISEVKYLEQMAKLLKNGQYFSLFEPPNNEKIEKLFNFLKNDYERITLIENIRKDELFKETNWKITQEVSGEPVLNIKSAKRTYHPYNSYKFVKKQFKKQLEKIFNQNINEGEKVERSKGYRRKY